MWKVKTKEPIEEIQEIEEPLDIEAEKRELTRRVNLLEQKEKDVRRKIEEVKPREEIINKQELIDAIQGNLARSSQLIEMLRRI